MNVAITSPGAFIAGPMCGPVSRYLRVVTRALDAERVAALEPVLAALDQAAAAQLDHDRHALDSEVASGWITVPEAADRLGVSQQNVRARLRRGTLAGERRGRAWLVDAPKRSETA
jgi:excisionase family DNA binding protein